MTARVVSGLLVGSWITNSVDKLPESKQLMRLMLGRNLRGFFSGSRYFNADHLPEYSDQSGTDNVG